MDNDNADIFLMKKQKQNNTQTNKQNKTQKETCQQHIQPIFGVLKHELKYEKLIERSRVCHNHKPQPTLDTKRKRKKDKNIHAQNKQTNVREAQRPAPSSPSEVIRMLKQNEKRGQRAREDFKTLSTPWYKP